MWKGTGKVPSCFIYVHPIDYAHGSVIADGLPYCTQTPVFHNCRCYFEYSCIKVLKRGGICAAETETLATHVYTGPVSSLSGLFKSSLCFYSVMCAYHCSDFSLAGGRTFQGNGWPRITHTHTQTQDDWVSEVLHPFVAQACLICCFLTDTWRFMCLWGKHSHI